MTQAINRQVLLAKRPEGAPKPGDFRVIDGSMPTAGRVSCCCATSTCRPTRTCAGE